jgi:hypothetical protein
MTKTQVEEAIWAELESYSGKDVKVYYEQGSNKIVWGFYIWGGNAHQQTTITELRQEGFELADIKMLRDEAESFLIRHFFNKLEVLK